MKLVITGGGTGGHIFAGVAIAQEFLSQSKGNDVLFIGSTQGLETRLVPKAGLKLEVLSLGKLVGQSFFARIKTLFQLPLAILKCIFILKKFKAEMVVGVGGYAAGPCIIAARLLQIPIGLLEQNSVMGFTNRISSKLAQHVFLAFEEIPDGVAKEKCVFTGNPTRSNMRRSQKKQDQTFTVFAFGGSQGATGINKMMVEAAAELKRTNQKIEILHQTGERDFDWVKKAYEELGVSAGVYKFIDDMQAMYDKADLIVCRAGSSTIAELGATQNAAIFIPFPLAAGNHQEINARVLEKTGACRVLVQGKNDGRDLANMINEFKMSPQQLQEMREKIITFYQPQAAQKIIEVMKVHSLYVQKK